MHKCKDIAEYFLSKIDLECGDLISNLKLQKLIYYAQGFSLALFNKPLFSEEIEAWTHGPVIPSLYHEYKGYGSASIPESENVDLSMFSDDEKELLDEVYSVYGQFSAWKLRNMTHEEQPWIEAEKYAAVISQDSMKAYFKTQIN